jgi:hypothetical protein
MPSSQLFPTHTLELQAAVEPLAHWLVGTAVHCVLGVALGMLGARLMRGSHLRWTWAAGVLALVVLAKPALGDDTLTLGVAALCATVRGRRWDREDMEAGGDLAALAAGRSGPLELMLRPVRAAAPLVREFARAETWLHRPELIVGRDERGRAVSIPFADGAEGRHCLVVGATGSGKTVTQSWIGVRAIDHGMGAIVIDPKGDRGMREEVRCAARKAGRPFIEWTPDGDCVYNPFARGGASEIADKALGGERFTEPHYLRQAQRYLGHVVRALRGTGTEVSLRTIVDHLDPQRLELLARELPEAEAGGTFSYLDLLSARQQSELAGVRDRLAILAESDVAPWLDPQTAGCDRFDLLTAIRERTIVYFCLEADSRPLLTQMLGSAIVQDLKTAMAACQSSPAPTLVVIDEFSAIASEHVVALFGRARSAGFSLLLGTQELSDLRPAGREHLLEQVLGNLSVLIAHRQVVPDSAQLIATMAGTRGAWRVSRHSDGRTTRARTREGVLDAERVMSLGRGWGAVLVLGDGGGVRITRMLSPARGR